MAKQLDNDLGAPPKIKEIEDAADNYVDVRDKRMKLTEKEIACKAVLIEVCQRNIDRLPKNQEGERIYRFGEEEVALSDKLNVKVRNVKSAVDE